MEKKPDVAASSKMYGTLVPSKGVSLFGFLKRQDFRAWPGNLMRNKQDFCPRCARFFWNDIPLRPIFGKFLHEAISMDPIS